MSTKTDFEAWLRAEEAKGLEAIRLTVRSGPGITREAVLKELLAVEAHLAQHGSGKPPQPSTSVQPMCP